MEIKQKLIQYAIDTQDYDLYEYLRFKKPSFKSITSLYRTIVN